MARARSHKPASYWVYWFTGVAELQTGQHRDVSNYWVELGPFCGEILQWDCERFTNGNAFEILSKAVCLACFNKLLTILTTFIASIFNLILKF